MLICMERHAFGQNRRGRRYRKGTGKGNLFRSDSLFSRFMGMLCDILWVGILWILGCIPIITAGASTTAAYYAMAKSVRHKTGYIHKEFFHSWRANWKQATIMTLVFVIAALVIVFDIRYVWVNDSKLNSALFMVLLLVSFLISSVTVYFCPFLSRFEKKNLEMLKFAAFAAFKYLPLTFGIIVLFVLAAVGVYLMPWSVFVIPGVYLFLLTYPMEYVMLKFMPVPEEGSEEAEKWYYQ